MGKEHETVLEAAGREVVVSNPDKVFFPRAGYTKLDLAKYYAAVAEGALRGIAARPLVLKRYVNGAEQEPFFQKRAPETHPEWVETVELRFPPLRGTTRTSWETAISCGSAAHHPQRCTSASPGSDSSQGVVVSPLLPRQKAATRAATFWRHAVLTSARCWS